MAAQMRGCNMGENENDSHADDIQPDSVSPSDYSYGHFFTKKTFHKPTYCHHCTDILWGLIRQGYVCEVCNFVVHDRCLKTVVSPCSSIASNLIKNPVAHCWSESGHFKRKFCNLCRRRLEDSMAVRCDICEYYAHVECQDFAVSDCKECATYVPQHEKHTVVQYHHWREGNLPANSKCLWCKKTCWSSECLAGMRCEWCGVTAHATCYKNLPEECSFGCLREIMLPPYCVTVPRMDVAMETLFGIAKRPNASGQAIMEDYSSVESLREDDCDRRYPKEREGKESKDRDEEIIRIFDGNNSLKQKIYRAVSVVKAAPARLLLEASLRTFHISDNPKNYYLTEISETDDGESNDKEIDISQPVRGQITTRDGRRHAVFLRYREKNLDRGYIKVYPVGGLSQKANVNYQNIPVTSQTTTQEVIELALAKYGIQGDSENFNLVEVMLDKGVAEREFDPCEIPWTVMQKGRRESLRQHRMMRFYLKQKEDPHGPQIAMYLGNLPTGLSQLQYEKILGNFLGKEVRWQKFDVIYYEYGALVMLFNSPETVVKAYHILSNATFDDKQLLVLLLPNIQAHMLPDHVTPLLLLVNVKSGGQQGMELIRSFRKLLNPHQVYNLMNGGPLPGLYVFRNIPYFRILVCGGDGTVGWALSCLDNVGQDAQCNSPPMAIVPLGTGNDLARVLRWGPGFTGAEDPLNVLRDVIDAEEIRLDRWTVIFHPNEKETDETKLAIANDTKSANTNEDTTSIFVMNNYFGIGLDAELCLNFHRAREENPDKFNSRIHNKGVYLKMGLRKMVNRQSFKDLQRAVRVEVDGKPVELPSVEGLIILNILSWASGANPWGPEREDQFARPTHYDGMLELVGVTGVVHMGQIQSGMRSAIRIAQGGHIRIQLLEELPVQVDGEPWIQLPGQVVVLRSALKATMLKKTKNKMKRRNTEPSIFFPNESLQPQSPNADGVAGPL